MNLLIYNLPNELLNNIFYYLDISLKVSLNKFYYCEYNYIIEKNLTLEKHNSLVRDIIRNDYIFVFKYIIYENFEKWNKLKKYEYKNIIYYNYITFLIYYCNKHSSSKCKSYIYLFCNKTLLKSNKIKYNKYKWIK